MNFIKRGTIQKYAKAYNLDLTVSSYTEFFVVHFAGAAQIQGPEFPLFTTGKGKTEEEAIADYASKISGEVLVFDDKRLLLVWELV